MQHQVHHYIATGNEKSVVWKVDWKAAHSGLETRRIGENFQMKKWEIML